jgi:outer membrane protein assembly factor BamB
LGVIALIVLALYGTSRLIHKSIANGMMGMMFPIFAIPVVSPALVAWAVASRRLSSGPRFGWLAVTLLVACGGFTLLRTGGITGEGDSDLHWRWTKTPEERLLAQGSGKFSAPASTSVATNASKGLAGATNGNELAVAEAEWPGFRGRERDGVVRNAVRIETDWSRSPPVQMWRRPIGPGWSSFAVRGDFLYTQEQRGDDELVSCYKLASGEPVWAHSDAVRFWESNAGPGPRATPTLSNGRVYAFGATGMLNALDAGTGAVFWSRNVAADADKKVPGWGFASSPLVVGDIVIVAASGKLAAYDVATGKPRWFGPAHGGSYSSPHFAKLGGIPQVLQLSGTGLTSVVPGDGSVLWEHAWDGVTMVQPALLGDGDVLISTTSASGGLGLRRLAVTNGSAGWTVQQRWASTGLKPYFNDLVIHKGHAFGFDGSILACIDLSDGKRKWKDGRYGNGQIILLPEQDLLLVLSEEGELALVGAVPDHFQELARFPAIKGKTWNHPLIIRDVLLVRNGEEMAAFRMSIAGPRNAGRTQDKAESAM